MAVEVSNDVVESVRLEVYSSFAVRGRAPSLAELAVEASVGADDVRRALRSLHERRDLVLGSDGEIAMAHPFTSVPLGFSVMGRERLWWGGCAWDSFAVPHLVEGEPEVVVATRCPGCDSALAWTVGIDGPPAGAEVAHFLTPVSRIWDDVVASCRHQQLFCSPTCVATWLDAEGLARGYVMDLVTLWRLARGWYAGRLDRGYRRRDPSSAAAYFAEVGLRGPFWGLPESPDILDA